MTAQDYFNTVATHLFTQGRRAYDNSTGCVYRAPDGTKCAVGVLIPDDKYDPKMDKDMNLAPVIEKAGLPLEHEELFRSLQRVHDDPENWSDTKTMRRRLTNVATEHDLDPSILDTLEFKR